MPTLQAFGLLILGLGSAIPVLFGCRYLWTSEFMPYHATVAGVPWQSIDARLQAVILGNLRVAGAGLAAAGVAMLWLLVPLSSGADWAPWAFATTALASNLPVLVVTIRLRRIEPAARTPVVPVAAGLAALLAGLVLVVLARG